MKKYLFILFVLFIATGCSVDNANLDNSVTISDMIEDDLPNEPEYVDENPVVVGLYQNGKLVDSVTAPFKFKTDITVFDIYFTNEEDVGSKNTKRNFTKYANNYVDSNKYKIGFYIGFSVGDDVIEGVITGPEHMYLFAPYIYNYLYDDVHQKDGTWYSHVEEKDVNENTIYSAIKLFGAHEIDKVTSPITLMVFTYDTPDDFDNDGMYRGNSMYTVTIKRGN